MHVIRPSLLSRTAGAQHLSISVLIAMESLPPVHIDSSGRFKYILIEVTEKKDKNNQKLIVRGYADCNYHGKFVVFCYLAIKLITNVLADILDKVSEGKENIFKFNCLGGGRILHKPESKELIVFGYSTVSRSE